MSDQPQGIIDFIVTEGVPSTPVPPEQPAGIVNSIARDGAIFVPFTTTAPGPFTLPNPSANPNVLVIPQMTSGGAVWLQVPAASATELFLTASDEGLTGFVGLYPEGFFDA
jgi:hypothetical protein